MIVIFCAFIYSYIATVQVAITAKVSAAEGDEYQIPVVECDEYTVSWLAHLAVL